MDEEIEKNQTNNQDLQEGLSQEDNKAQDFDISSFEDGLKKDEAKLSLLQEEYNNVADRLHDEYEDLLEQNPKALFSEEELESLASDTNIASKNRMLRDRFEKYRDEKLALKQNEISKFEEELGSRKEQFDTASSWTKFSKENPSVNMDDFGEFIQEDLTTRQRTSLIESSKTKYDFLVGAYSLYKQTKGKNEDDDEDLPPDLNMVNGATGDNSFSSEDEKQEYLKAIGLNRD